MYDKYEPELGQFAFGQPWKEFECPKLLESALRMIDDELDRIMWNIHQEKYPSPFSNTANDFKCDAFEVDAYNWGDDDQPYNFKWRDVEISWYKYLGRGMSVNQKISNDKISEMLDDCMDALRRYEEEHSDMSMYF